MPLIRLARDKRGLDTFYLLHQRSDAGGARLRVLYFSSAPQGLSFGRSWLDADTQRALERQHPDVQFGWPALLRELEQRRLPVATEPQVRRSRPPVKAERRPPASDSAADRTSPAKRKRRRGSGPNAASPDRVGNEPAATGHQAEAAPAASANDPSAPPIIE